MPFEFTITTRGFRELDRLVDRFQDMDLDVPIGSSAAALLNRIRARFLDQVDTDGNPWPPSAAAQREGRATLFDTGNLFFSLQAEVFGDGRARLVSDVPYSIFHQEGQGQERREFLGFSDEDEELAVQIHESFLNDLANDR